MPFFVKNTVNPRTRKFVIFALYPDRRLVQFATYDKRTGTLENIIPEKRVRTGINVDNYINTRLQFIPMEVEHALQDQHWVGEDGEDIDPAFADSENEE
jgi:hypothetical protein